MIYLDHSASTPVAPQVLDAMLPYFSEHYANPSSVHRPGQKAEAALEEARENIATCLHCRPDEMFFTSGGTESNNLAIRGAAYAVRKHSGKTHLLTTPVEHPAVLNTVKDLAGNFSFQMALIPVNHFGTASPEGLRSLIQLGTVLASVIYANNEVGTINPIDEIGEICREKGILLHADAVQAAGYLDIDLSRTNVDMLSIGAHKFYGPKGVGALFIRKGTRIQGIQTGGSHERGLRAGTSNVPLIVGMAAALKLAVELRDKERERLSRLRDELVERVLRATPDARLTGDPIQRLPHHASFIFPGVDGNQLVMLLDHAGFACSSGSACKTGNPEPSEVLLAIGYSADDARSSLRITLGRSTTQEQITAFCETLANVINKASV